MFIVEQTGRIRILKNGRIRSTPFLDIRGAVSGGSEQGLLGLAFHPRYAETGRFGEAVAPVLAEAAGRATGRAKIRLASALTRAVSRAAIASYPACPGSPWWWKPGSARGRSSPRAAP